MYSYCNTALIFQCVRDTQRPVERRRGSCSTRTTHPVVIAKLKKLFENVGMPINVVNPYEFMTKGEMVHACANRPFLLDVLPVSNSCGKRARKQFRIWATQRLRDYIIKGVALNDERFKRGNSMNYFRDLGVGT